MLTRLAALGALGYAAYAGYKYYQKNGHLPSLDEIVETVSRKTDRQHAPDGVSPM